MIKCGLCGFEFDERTAGKSCGGCSLAKTCKLIRCPNCGYETPPEPRWLKVLLKNFKRPKKDTSILCPVNIEKKQGEQIISLDAMAAEQKGRIACIQTTDRKKLQKLMAMGIVPGAGITLLQSFPAYVFQIGQSQFAIDKDLASAIFVHILGAD
ncbi:MAG: FeoA family protein [Candidatus Omnitrophica bacterium]|nr:FeoA family protein [Candidatus Omnitrophota bacterium]